MSTRVMTSLCGAVLAAFSIAGCSRQAETKSPDVKSAVHQSLEQAGLKDVSVDQDRDKGVVTLGGHVASDDGKMQAERIAQSLSAGQVIANQIAVLPAGVEREAKKINSDLDDGIEKNLHASLVAGHFDSQVKYDVKNRVVTLKGAVDSQARRELVAKVASGVPNVEQVVNELQVKDQKATSN